MCFKRIIVKKSETNFCLRRQHVLIKSLADFYACYFGELLQTSLKSSFFSVSKMPVVAKRLTATPAFFRTMEVCGGWCAALISKP